MARGGISSRRLPFAQFRGNNRENEIVELNSRLARVTNRRVDIIRRAIEKHSREA